ncbi:MAG TPA: methyltransferase domain-containing protein [Candidatus Binatia bacterium]|nr:methyltransferase domain-containing protein [Candidatus Binatia bacterium]
MATRAPDPTMTGPNYASAEYAEQWRRGKRLRGEASEALTGMMLDLANIQVGDRVLELATGMGDLAIMSARRVGPNGYVLATDISANMLDLAAETLREASLTNVETRVMDAENLDVAPDSFNVALCRSALMLFPNAAKALAGVYRALKPAGRFVVTVWSTAETNPFHGMPLAIVSRLAKVPLPAPGQPGLFALSGQGVLEECYTKAGFRDVAVRAVSVQRRFPSTAEALSAMKESFPRLQTLLTKLSDADRQLAWSEIERQLTQFDGPSGFNAPGEWLVGVGTK